jgi:huntingtin interacting protein 1
VEALVSERIAENGKLQSQLEQMMVQHASAEATASNRQVEIDQLRQQLEASAVEQNKLMELSTQRQADINRLRSQLSEVTAERESTEQRLKDSEGLVARLQGDLEKLRSDRDTAETALRSQMSADKLQMLASAIVKGEAIVRDALAQADNPHHLSITCTAEYLMNRTQPALESLAHLTKSCDQFSHDENAVCEAIKAVCEFSHQLGDTVVFGFATAHTASIEAGEELGATCRSAGDGSLALLSMIKAGSFTDVASKASHVEESLRKILAQAELLLPKVEDVRTDMVGDMVDEEMQLTTKAIEEAAAKIADMLASSRENFSGIQLEVNEKILDSCNQLMMAIRVLIEKSKALQKEIVAQGRGTSSIKEFYKKHHRWTEGLISAAKAVGYGANVLVDTADRVVRGNGKYEELMVCSQEIAASTAQLVVASKVKAQRGSENLHHLANASKGVSSATGLVVASAKTAVQRIEEMDTVDFTRLTLHQAKRLEMESQVHVLELESKLERERRSLCDLRKAHYRLAGESEGWDQEQK